MKSNRTDPVTALLQDIGKIVGDKNSMALLKKLEEFKEECETYGVYTDTKSISRLRRDLQQAKRFREIREGTIQ